MPTTQVGVAFVNHAPSDTYANCVQVTMNNQHMKAEDLLELAAWSSKQAQELNAEATADTDG